MLIRFIWGWVLIKMALYIKTWRAKQIADLLSSITLKEQDNKIKPDPHFTQDILQDRQQLRSLLRYKHENHLKFLKASYYALQNKAGAWLARKVKAKHIKQRIAALAHPLNHNTLFIPKDIANIFADYYQSLYDLCNDVSTPQPSPAFMNAFLFKVKLPNLTEDQLDSKSISQIFTTQEICLAINKLPNHKSLQRNFPTFAISLQSCFVLWHLST